MSTPTDLDHAVGAALAYAEDHWLADTIDIGHDRILVRVRDGSDAGEHWEEHDTSDPHPEHPRRARGTVQVHDAASFITAINTRTSDPALVNVYADEEKQALVAVLNDDLATVPGHRDYRVSLALRPTPEWSAWKGGQGLGEQQRFAERIEDGEPEITDPSPAVMLEIAQTFHASVGVEFRSATRLNDGNQQFTYVEDTKASAGAKPGAVTIPATFELAVKPFVGSERFAVTARLRYRINGGKLQIGYQLVRPEDVERAAFADVVAATEAGLACTFLAGPAPAQAS